MKKADQTDEEVIDTLRQPVWHVLVLSITTLTAYIFYWCYKTWRDLALHFHQSTPEHEALSDCGAWLGPKRLASFQHVSPGLRTVVMFIPYANDYLFFTLALGIAQRVPNLQSFPCQHPMLCAVGLSMVHFLAAFFAFFPEPWVMLYVLAALPAALLQHWLNKFWAAVHPDKKLMRHGFNFGEIIAIVLGSLLWGLIVVGFSLPIKK